MIRPRLRLAGALAALSIAGLLASCSADAESTGPAVSGPGDEQEEVSMPLPDERAPGVPEECFEHYPWATGPADPAALTSQPDDWPDPPAGSTLCATSGGGASEMASYVTPASTEEILDHYESALQGYQVSRISGEENGTGYDSLDGSNDRGLSFQVREADGGFILTFIDGGAFG